jgi:hypothetical protein
MRSFFKATLLTGLLVGTTDIIAAAISVWINSGNFPVRMLHYIAGGALGLETSMKGGPGIALFGLLIHYFIAYSWTLFFFTIFPKLKFLSFNKYGVGLLYGYFVGAMMNFVILPMTPLPNNPFVFTRALIGWTILGVVLGIPIAISAYRFYNVMKERSAVPEAEAYNK